MFLGSEAAIIGIPGTPPMAPIAAIGLARLLWGSMLAAFIKFMGRPWPIPPIIPGIIPDNMLIGTPMPCGIAPIAVCPLLWLGVPEVGVLWEPGFIVCCPVTAS